MIDVVPEILELLHCEGDQSHFMFPTTRVFLKMFKCRFFLRRTGRSLSDRQCVMDNFRSISHRTLLGIVP